MRNSRRNGEPLNKTGKTASITAFRKSLIHQIVRLVFLYSAASLTGFAQTGQDVSGMTDETGLRAIISKLSDLPEAGYPESHNGRCCCASELGYPSSRCPSGCSAGAFRVDFYRGAGRNSEDHILAVPKDR